MKFDRLLSATYFIRSILLCVVAVACNQQRHEPFNGDRAFRMSAPSRLYFANVRSSNYYHERPQATDLDVYRLRKFSHTANRPQLLPVIVQAYLKDEAYLFLRKNEYPGIADPLTIIALRDSTETELQLEMPTKEQQLSLALIIAERLRAGDSLSLMLTDGRRLPIYQTRAERSYFLTVLRDYEALTDRKL